jgi:hypothetical protein
MGTIKKTSLALRLERLRATTGQTWDALAIDLGVKRAMIFHVLSGRRGFSEKTLQQLQECEVAAGLRSQASVMIEKGLSGTDLVEALLNADESNPVTIEDIDAGWKVIPLEYRRGSPPPNFPRRVTVKAADNATVRQILGVNTARQDSPGFLLACLPDLQNKPEVLERLTPTCYSAILDTAFALTFGLNWRTKLQPAEPAKKKQT